MPNKNSATYLTLHTFLHAEVTALKKTAESIESQFGIFFADLLMEILNISVGKETEENRPFMNYKENEAAREKEILNGKFIVRKEFITPIRKMKMNVVRSFVNQLRWEENVLMQWFHLYINQFETGTLHPDQILDELCVMNGMVTAKQS